MHQPRVLVVDDEPAVRALLMRALGEAAYEMVAVPVDRAGMEAAGASGVPYQLVITNSHTPSMTGEQLLDHLRCLFAGLPILHLDDVRPFGIDALLRAVALAVPERPIRQEV
jgi:DNA-binding response OmpR family regulator